MMNLGISCLAIWFLFCICVIIAILVRSVIGPFQDGKAIIQEFNKEPRSTSNKILFTFFWLVIFLLVASIFFVGK